MIELRVLGPIQLRRADGVDANDVTAAGRNVSAVLSQPKRLAVTAFLAAPPPHGGRCLHRKDTLVAMFWPELDQARARAALRNTMYFLRQHLGPDAVVNTNDTVGLAPPAVWCDLDAFDIAVRARDAATAWQLYRGPLLEGLFVSDAEPFEEWLEAQRQRRTAELRDLVTLGARRHAAAGRLDDALVWARRARAMDPSHEDAARLVIALCHATGNRAAALDEYRRLEQYLLAEHGVPPANDTRKLAEAVRAGADDPLTLARSVAQVRLPASAVRASATSPTDVASIAPVTVHERAVLDAHVAVRLGQAQRRGHRVPLVRVGLPQATDRRVATAAALAQMVRRADLLARLDDDTCVIVPDEDGAGDVQALLQRLERLLASALTGVPGADPPSLAIHWADPGDHADAAQVLAVLSHPR